MIYIEPKVLRHLDLIVVRKIQAFLPFDSLTLDRRGIALLAVRHFNFESNELHQCLFGLHIRTQLSPKSIDDTITDILKSQQYLDYLELTE